MPTSKTKAKDILYSRLPEPFQSAVESYFAARGEDAAGSRWSWATIRLDVLLAKVWDHMTLMEAVPRGVSFGEYHEGYIEEAGRSEDWPPEWAKRDPDSIWPIILEGSPRREFGATGIEDGWHRFHWYVDRWPGSKRIPVMWREA